MPSLPLLSFVRKGFDFVDSARKVTFAEELQDIELFKVLHFIEDIFELSTNSID